MDKKYCSDCKDFVITQNFNKNRRNKDGLSTYCKKHDYLRKKKSVFKLLLKEIKNNN